MRRLLVLTAVSALLFAVGCQKKDEAVAKADAVKEVKEIVIGVQGPETGEIANYGLQTLYGAQLAVAEINAAGGINGKPVKLVHYDSRGDKVEAVNVTQRLINNDKVCGIIGEPTSGALSALRGVANKEKTIAISAGATAIGVTDGHPFIFRNTLLDKDGAPATMKFLNETRGWKNYVLITSTNNDYSVGLSESFREAVKAAGGTIVAEQSINDKDSNMSAQVTSIKNKKFDAVIFTGYYQEASLIMMELRKQGLNAPLIGGDGYQASELYNIAKDASVGSIFFAGFFTDSDNPRIIAFNKKIKEMGYDSNIFSAQGYDAMYLLTDAAKAANVTDCSDAAQRTSMRDALATVKDFDGISGKMSFDAEGNAVKNPFVQSVEKTADGYRFILLNK